MPYVYSRTYVYPFYQNLQDPTFIPCPTSIPESRVLDRKLNSFNKNTFFPKGKDGDVKVDDISAKTMKLLLIFIYKDILAKGGLISEWFFHSNIQNRVLNYGNTGCELFKGGIQN
jgi:hypothetical protein